MGTVPGGFVRGSQESVDRLDAWPSADLTPAAGTPSPAISRSISSIAATRQRDAARKKNYYRLFWGYFATSFKGTMSIVRAREFSGPNRTTIKCNVELS